MKTDNSSIYSLLPAIFRTRDAGQGGTLEALFQVLENQYGIVRENLLQLYDDQFIETCAPWVIPYIGELIGFNQVYTGSLIGADSRAEIANTIGSRRRKGTLVALEQVTRDVSGRPTLVVESFRRLVVNLSLRDVWLDHNATANLRRAQDLEDQTGPFSLLNRSIDVRRIAPRVRKAPSPDPVPMDIGLHGPGRANLPNVEVWMWRWKQFRVNNAPAFDLGGGVYFFSALGGPVPLFSSPNVQDNAPFSHRTTEDDISMPISRRRLRENIDRYYGRGLQLWADGTFVYGSQIVCANLEPRPDGSRCQVAPGKIAIDPILGKIQFASDMPLPTKLFVSYSYGAPSAMGGGSYDRSNVPSIANSGNDFLIIVGRDAPTVEEAVAIWNNQPPGAKGLVLLPDFESYDIGLTGIPDIQIPIQSQLTIASARIWGSPLQWSFSDSCVTLRGNIVVVGPPNPIGPDGLAIPSGQLQINGIWLSGEVRIEGTVSVQISDSTLIPGRSLDENGKPGRSGLPSINGNAIGASVCLTRVISGPVALPTSCSLRVCASIIDSGEPVFQAIAGADLVGAGPNLHIEDSTVVGWVWVKAIRLASNTIFHARQGDSRLPLVRAQRLQVGCVRFCWLPPGSMTPRRYECLSPDFAGLQDVTPIFVSLRLGNPSYGLLSSDAPMAIWKGADNGSQMGAFFQIQETEALANIQIRSPEYLPANMEAGVFLVSSRQNPESLYSLTPYGYRISQAASKMPPGIGVDLLQPQSSQITNAASANNER